MEHPLQQLIVAMVTSAGLTYCAWRHKHESSKKSSSNPKPKSSKKSASDPKPESSTKSAERKRQELAIRLGRPLTHINSYEEMMACFATNPHQIAVGFNSIGGLESQQKAIFELATLALKRPDLFSKGGKLLDGGLSKSVLLYGPPGTGKTMLAKAIAKESEAVFIHVMVSSVISRCLSGESQKLVAAVFSLAHKLQPAVVYIDEVVGILGRHGSSEHVSCTSTKNEFVALWDGLEADKNVRVMVLGATTSPSKLAMEFHKRFAQSFEIGMPGLKERAEILRLTLRGERVEDNIDCDHLASLTEDYSGSDLLDLCKQAAQLPLKELLGHENSGIHEADPRLLSQQDLESALAASKNKMTAANPTTQGRKTAADQAKEISERLGRPLIETTKHEDIIASGVINPDHIDVEFSSIGGLQRHKQEIFELTILPLKRPELFSSGKLLGPSKGVLLYGPPGTGKTMLAKAIAKESGAVFINVKVSDLINKYIGETNKHVAAVFSLAHKLQPAIIFIDEVDSLLGQRSHSEHQHYTNMKTEFMTLWDGFTTDKNARVMVLGATNRPSELDEAFLRRFTRSFEIGMPELKERVEILKVILRGERVEDDIDFDHLASLANGYSGSDLFDICKQAAFAPIKELLDDERKGNPSHDPRPLSQRDLETALATYKKTKTTAREYSRMSECSTEDFKKLSYYI